KIDRILNEIGCDKFAAIMTDNASNVKLAQQIIHNKHPNILSLNCIAHCINLVSKDILKHTFSSRLIKECNEVIKFFKKSHMPNSCLSHAISELKISGGGLRKFIDTRWTSAYECTSSVCRLERAFIKILYPIRIAIMNLEAQTTNLADCFLQFVQLAAAIKKFQIYELKGLKAIV
ncbi:15413_t:CDS:2, partial [Gigaspora rosea]